MKGGSSEAEDREGPAEQRTEFNILKCVCPTLPLLLRLKSVLPCVTHARLSDAVGQEQAVGHQRLEGGGQCSPVVLLVPSCSSHVYCFFALDIGTCRYVASQFRELTWMEREHFISAG